MNKLINILPIIFIAFFVQACQTPGVVRQTTPAFEAKNIKKTAREITECISDKWSNAKPGMFFSSPIVTTNLIKNGYAIIVTDYNFYGSSFTAAVADITENSNESTLKYYLSPSYSLMDDYEMAVTLCI